MYYDFEEVNSYSFPIERSSMLNFIWISSPFLGLSSLEEEVWNFSSPLVDIEFVICNIRGLFNI
jgi:hypothetical protein